MKTVIKTTTENNKQVDTILEIVVKHHEGYYKLHCNVLRDEHDGFITWTPFVEGDFNVKIAAGRKSQKKLDLFNLYISNNFEKLVDLWNKKEYKTLALCVQEVNV